MKQRVSSLYALSVQASIGDILLNIKHVQAEHYRGTLDYLPTKLDLDFDPVRTTSRTYSNRRTPQTTRAALYTRKTDNSPLTVRSNLNLPFLRENESQFAEALYENDLHRANECLINMMIVAVEQDNYTLLMRLFQLNALTFILFREYSKALILLSSCRLLSQHVAHFEGLIWTFQQIGFVCKYLKKYDLAMIFQKKVSMQNNQESLEYSWYINSIDLELKCYEELGRICYLNYDLNNAKQLHEKAVLGQYEKQNSAMRKISELGASKALKAMVPSSNKINQGFLSKAVNFPFRLVNNVDPSYYHMRKVKNEYMIMNNLHCVPSHRVLDSDSSIDEIVAEIMKCEHFVFEMPLPISVNFNEEQADEQHTNSQTPKRQQMKDRRMMTLLKLSSQKDMKQTVKHVSPVFRLDPLKQKKPLEELIEQRLQQKYDTDIMQRQVHMRKFNNLDTIILTHEQLKKNNNNAEHTKTGLLKFAQKLLTQEKRQNPTFTQLISPNTTFRFK